MTETRMGITLTVVGAPVTLTGAAMYALPGPGFPVLTTGLSSAGHRTRHGGHRPRQPRVTT